MYNAYFKINNNKLIVVTNIAYSNIDLKFYDLLLLIIIA